MAVLSVERLKGMDLYDRNNEQAGDIRDLIVDPEDCAVRYALLGTGGVLSALGIQDRLFAIPIDRLSVGQDRIRLDADRGVLREAPSFSAYQPPEFTRDYERRLAEFWGVRLYWEQPGYHFVERRVVEVMAADVPTVRPDTSVAKVADLLDRTGNQTAAVVDERGQYVGTITSQDISEQVLGAKAPRRHAEESAEQRPATDVAQQERPETAKRERERADDTRPESGMGGFPEAAEPGIEGLDGWEARRRAEEQASHDARDTAREYESRTDRPGPEGPGRQRINEEDERRSP